MLHANISTQITNLVIGKYLSVREEKHKINFNLIQEKKAKLEKERAERES